MSQQPLVSIVMAVYTCEKLLPEALESIEGQTYSNWELVVCDDASTDGTFAVVENFAARYPGKVIVLQNEVNSKLPYSLNRCLAEANGDLIARMDGDDKCLPERFAKQVEFLIEHPEIDLVGTAIRRFDEAGEHDVVEMESFPNRLTLRRNVPFVHATVMVRSSVYRVLGGYETTARAVRCEDVDLWFRFFHEGFEGANIAEPLYLVREDIEAIRRRTFQNRWNLFRTTIFGYRLLNFPIRSYAKPIADLAKVLIPTRGVLVYRRIQARKQIADS